MYVQDGDDHKQHRRSNKNHVEHMLLLFDRAPSRETSISVANLPRIAGQCGSHSKLDQNGHAHARLIPPQIGEPNAARSAAQSTPSAPAQKLARSTQIGHLDKTAA
jgi:hypothetical protein